jgi:cytochrome c oxidase subunit 2
MQITLLYLCTIVAAVVFGVMLYSIATFRGPQGTTPATFRRCSMVEVIWALVPLAIFIAATLPSLRLIETSPIAIAEAR